MNLNPFTWLREQARAHFLDGVADACDSLATGDRLPQRLQGRLVLALPAPLTDEENRRGELAHAERQADEARAEFDGRRRKAR